MIPSARPPIRLWFLIALSIITILCFFTLTSIRFEVRHSRAIPFRPVEKAQQPLAKPAIVQPLQPNAQQEKLRDLQLLWSKRNPDGLLNLVDDHGIKPIFYNPTWFELPQGSSHHFMVFGRLRHVEIEISHQTYRKSQLIAFFANLTQDGFGNPVMRRFDSWNVTFVDDLYEPQGKAGCGGFNYNYIGAEDVKAWWTASGAPMLIFTNVYPIGDPKECFSMYLIDARAAVPKFAEVLGEYGQRLPPIEIEKPVRLHREEYQKIEKNWAPFQAPLGPDAGETFLSVDLDGQRVYKFDQNKEFVQPVKSREATLLDALRIGLDSKEEQKEENKACLHNLMDKYGYWQIHQGTVILSMTLCNRGECEPDIHNTVNFGIIQGKYTSPLNWYEPRVVTWNITQPFEWRSISKRLSYHGTKSREYVYTMSMSYYWDTADPPENRAHGYLDDEVWLGMGVADSQAWFIDVDARELMRDHHFCDGANLDYRI